MKHLLYFLMPVLLLSSCKLTQEDLQNFDMTIFCDDYHILMSPHNETMYVFIDRKEPKQRFFVWKNYGYKGTEYGYMYSYKYDPADAVKNGIYGSAKEAVRKGAEYLPKDGTVLYLHNLMWLGQGQWVTNGSLLNELCPSASVEECPKKPAKVQAIQGNGRGIPMTAERASEEIMQRHASEIINAPAQLAPDVFIGKWQTVSGEDSYLATYYDIEKKGSNWSNGNSMSFNFRNHMSGDTLLLVYVSSEVSGRGWVEQVRMPTPNSLYAKLWMENGHLRIKYMNGECISSFEALYSKEDMAEAFSTTLYRN